MPPGLCFTESLGNLPEENLPVYSKITSLIAGPVVCIFLSNLLFWCS